MIGSRFLAIAGAAEQLQTEIGKGFSSDSNTGINSRTLHRGDGGNIFDPQANAIAAVRSLQDKSKRFSREFGREPSATELYLMHQQGEGGLRAHSRSPDAPAWQNMHSTGEGRRKGPRWAKLAIWGNVPTDMRKLFGSVENITSRQFIAVWTAKMLGIPFQQALAMNG